MFPRYIYEPELLMHVSITRDSRATRIMLRIILCYYKFIFTIFVFVNSVDPFSISINGGTMFEWTKEKVSTAAVSGFDLDTHLWKPSHHIICTQCKMQYKTAFSEWLLKGRWTYPAWRFCFKTTIEVAVLISLNLALVAQQRDNCDVCKVDMRSSACKNELCCATGYHFGQSILSHLWYGLGLQMHITALGTSLLSPCHLRMNHHSGFSWCGDQAIWPMGLIAQRWQGG